VGGTFCGGDVLRVEHFVGGTCLWGGRFVVVTFCWRNVLFVGHFVAGTFHGWDVF